MRAVATSVPSCFCGCSLVSGSIGVIAPSGSAAGAVVLKWHGLRLLPVGHIGGGGLTRVHRRHARVEMGVVCVAARPPTVSGLGRRLALASGNGRR